MTIATNNSLQLIWKKIPFYRILKTKKKTFKMGATQSDLDAYVDPGPAVTEVRWNF